MIGFTIITLISDSTVVRAAAPTIQLQAGRFDWHHFLRCAQVGNTARS